MPARSAAQQMMMAIALHNPDKIKAKNKGVLKMKKSSMREYAKTKQKGLPKRITAMEMLKLHRLKKK